MVRGARADQARAIDIAFDRGIDWFDTAPQYGDGESETTLGKVLGRRGRVSTKVRLAPGDRGRIGAAIELAMEASLTRLGRDGVELYQLHNIIGPKDEGTTLSPRTVLEEVVPAFRKLREQGKARFLGLTAIGDAAGLAELVTSGAFDSAQVPFNLLNPTGVEPPPPGFVGEDFRGLMKAGATAGVGTIGIRILAAGALSGEAARHPVAAQNVAPIASGADYAADLAVARRFLPLVAEGFCRSLTEAAIRFAITPPEMSMALIGVASVEQFEAAADAAAKGPLPQAALDRIAALRAG